MLLDQGYGIQNANWFVDEKRPQAFAGLTTWSPVLFFSRWDWFTAVNPPCVIYFFLPMHPFSIQHQPNHPYLLPMVPLKPFSYNGDPLIKIDVPFDSELFHLISAFRCSCIQNPTTTVITSRHLADALTSFFNEKEILPQPAAAEWTDYLQEHACENGSNIPNCKSFWLYSRALYSPVS